MKKGQQRAKELNARFADWYYVVGDETYHKIHLGQAEIVKKKGPRAARNQRCRRRNSESVSICRGIAGAEVRLRMSSPSPNLSLKGGISYFFRFSVVALAGFFQLLAQLRKFDRRLTDHSSFARLIYCCRWVQAAE